jgi:hypothetical protein
VWRAAGTQRTNVADNGTQTLEWLDAKWGGLEECGERPACQAVLLLKGQPAPCRGSMAKWGMLEGVRREASLLLGTARPAPRSILTVK